MALLNLPNELLLLIGEKLRSSDLNSLCQTNRYLCTLLTPLFHNSMDASYVLRWAATNNREPLLKLAISKGADLSSVDSSGRAALHIAAEKGYSEIIETLLENGVDIDMRSRDGDRPIHIAVGNNDDMLVLWLIDRGASAYLEDDRIYPLMIAIWLRNPAIIDILRDRSAVPDW